MDMKEVFEGAGPLALAVGMGYVIAVLLGCSFGKLHKVGPLIRGIWYTAFWISVVVQSAAIVAMGLSFWLKLLDTVPQILLGIDAVLNLASCSLMVLTFWVDSQQKKSRDGLELDGAAKATSDVADLALSPLLIASEGEGCWVVLAILVVGFVLFGISFFPQRFLVRTTARIFEVGILKA